MVQYKLQRNFYIGGMCLCIGGRVGSSSQGCILCNIMDGRITSLRYSNPGDRAGLHKQALRFPKQITLLECSLIRVVKREGICNRLLLDGSECEGQKDSEFLKA